MRSRSENGPKTTIHALATAAGIFGVATIPDFPIRLIATAALVITVVFTYHFWLDP